MVGTPIAQDGRAILERAATSSRPSTAGRTAFSGRLARALTIAAAVTGAVEILLVRLAAPVLSHVPTASEAPGLAVLADSTGRLALGVTSVLVLLAAAAWAAHARARDRFLAISILTAVTATLAVGILHTHSLTLLVHLAVMLGVGAVVRDVVGRVPVLYGGGVMLVATAIAAGQWPHLLESQASLTGIGWGAGAPTLSRGLAEGALVGAVILFSASLVRSGTMPRRAWAVAAGAGLTAGLSLTQAGDHVAIASLWAVGATLWLPAIAYVAAAAAAGMLLATWLGDRSTLHLAAAVVLLAVAGVDPMLVHHNLTALIALTALAPLSARTRQAEASSRVG